MPKTMVQPDGDWLPSDEYQEDEVADAAEDQPTSDMLTGFKADLEKHMWMLRSFLG